MKNKLATVNIQVKNIEQSVQFYTTVFGLTVNKQRSHAPGFFYLDSPGAHLTLQQGREDGAGSAMEMGFEVENLEDVAKALASFPIAKPVPQTMGWGQAIEASDLDGHRIIAYQLRDNS